MNSEQLIANYSPAGDMITIIICLGLLLIISKALFFSEDRKFVFLKRSVLFIVVGALSNIAFYVVAKNNINSPLPLYALRDLYHFSFLCCLYCYILYMKKMLDVKGNLANAVSHVTRFVFCGCLIFEVLSPITKFGFHYADGEWMDSVISPYNVFYCYALVILCAMLVLYSERLIRSVRVCLIITEATIAVIMAYQGYLNINTFSSFTFIMPLLIVMILLHSRPFDDKTGALSSSSFDSYIKQAYQKGTSIDYMVLKLYINVTNQIPDELGKVLNSFWHSSFKDATLFSLSSDLYILAIPKGGKNGDTEEKINNLVRKYFQSYYQQYQLPYKMVKMYDIDFVNGLEDILGILKYLFQNMEENSEFVVDQKEKSKLKEYKKIRAALAEIDESNDLNDPRVLVYCQPIRNMKTGKFDTAEALMRLSLPDVGFVMPYMFIELAEVYNHIHALTKIMLNKVCAEVKKLENEGYSFERISVNFAISEIKADGFCDELY